MVRNGDLSRRDGVVRFLREKGEKKNGVGLGGGKGVFNLQDRFKVNVKF